MQNSQILRIFVAAVCLTQVACSNYRTTPLEKKRFQTFSMATRQLPPEPAYASTRWVRPTQVTPSRETPGNKVEPILPVVHYKVTDTPLCEAALVLAATTRYRSYCSSRLSGEKLSFEGLGTLDELAIEIAMLSGAEIIVDHSRGEIRFLGKGDL